MVRDGMRVASRAKTKILLLMLCKRKVSRKVEVVSSQEPKRLLLFGGCTLQKLNQIRDLSEFLLPGRWTGHGHT
jgi:hypothetical protein